MKKILVSLVSEQTIPNILVAMHYKPDILWFVSTKKMEEQKKSASIEDTLKIRGFSLPRESVKKSEVNQDSLSDCINKMEAFLESVEKEEVEYIVNLTGGTKVMALAAYEVFREIGQKVSIVYMPLGKNKVIQLFPRKKELKVYEIEERLNLIEYLSGYGFKIQNKDKLQQIHDAALQRKDFSRWILDNYEQLRGVLGFLYKQLGDNRSQKQYTMSATFERTLRSVEKDMLERIGFEVKGRIVRNSLKKDEIIYLTGGWFEEYVFNEISPLAQEGLIDDAKMGIVIESLQGAVNELDVALVKDNTFYHLECKTMGDKGEQIVISDEVYKKGAISSLLGKGEKRAMICTTHDQIKDALKRRGEDYGVEVFTLKQSRDIRNLLRARFGAKNE